MGAVTPEYNRSKIHQHKFALWVGIGSIIMMFGALTSAYIVRRNSGNWFEFKIPDIFFLNTAVIVLSRRDWRRSEERQHCAEYERKVGHDSLR